MSATWDDHGRLVLSGEVDLDNVDQFRTAVDEAILLHPDLTIDASGLEFCDSTCIACILRALQAGLRVRIIHASPTLRRILAIAGLDEHELLTVD